MEGIETHIPVLPAYVDADCLRVWCIHCRCWHVHGLPAGHRGSHCFKADSPYRQTGYFLRIVGQWQGERKMPRATKEAA